MCFQRGPECDHDLHVLRAYYAIRCALNLILGDIEFAEEAKAKPEDRVLETARAYIVGMSKVEFQVTTMEKIFCLLFMKRQDIGLPPVRFCL